MPPLTSSTIGTEINTDRSIADRLRPMAGLWWVRATLAVLLAAAVLRLISSGVLLYMGTPANVLGLEPLFALRVDGKPITELGPRSYGVVAMLLYDPAAILFGRDPRALNLWGLALSLVSVAGSFVLVAARLDIRRPLALAALGLLWAGFLPIVYAISSRMLDLLLMLSFAAAFFLYAGPLQRSHWSGAAIAAGSLTKFLPLIFMPYLLFRQPRAFAVAVGTGLALLAVGQAVYGTALGFGYPYHVFGPTAGYMDLVSAWHEGFSPRQLLYKYAAGHHLDVAYVALPDPRFVNLLSYAIQLAALAYLVYVAVRHRGGESLERRAIEFSFVVATLYMVSPTIGHEHLPSLIIVYTVLAWHWLRSPLPLPRPLVAMAVLSLALTGVYAPMQVVGAVLPLDGIMRALGNQDTPIYGSPVGVYDFLGFPGYGAILAWIVILVLERRTRVTGRRPA